MKTVYLGGPITDLNKGQANDWRKYVTDNLEQHNIAGVSPLRCEPKIGRVYKKEYDCPKFGSPQAIAAKNEFDVRSCDMSLIYLPKPIGKMKHQSYGTIIEMAWSYVLNTPTVVVSNDKEILGHPLVQASASWLLDDMADALEVIRGVLSVYTKEFEWTPFAGDEYDQR